jgi:alpha-1,3-rhamnosyltransferase
MSDLPLVSIVVVSYNQGKYIRENLDSIKAQTYPNIELIVADDASQDNSVDVFNEWLKENNYPAQTNYHTKNTGLATTLNESVEMVTGKYVKFIAADDFLHPESIEKCVQRLEDLGEEYGMVHTNVHCIDDASKIIEDRIDLNKFNDVDKDEFRRNLLKSNTIAALSVVLRTEVLRETGLYDNTFLVEDFYRWLKINEKYYIAYVAEKLAFYRLHPTNISALKQNIVEEDVYILKMLFDQGLYHQEIKSYVFNRYLNADVTPRLLKYYRNYQNRDKQLLFFINGCFPAVIYRIYNKFLRFLQTAKR